MEKRITEILILAMAAGAKIEIQYKGNREDQWTCAIALTPRICEVVMDEDHQVANFRLTLHT